jgi:hypothetical protein
VRSSGDRLRAEVHDNGNAQQLIIPKQMPSPEQVDGRGLWLISELADAVELETANGTTVRIDARLTR